MTLTVVGDGPVVTRDDGPPGHDAVLPGTFHAQEDGTLLGFFTWFGPAIGDQVVTVGRSTDGQAWTIDPDPIYEDFDLLLSPPGPIPSAAVQLDDGSWVLYGWAAEPTRRTQFFSWRATAPAPDGPWTVAEGQDRTFDVGPSGAWDDETAAIATVLRDESGYRMWYEGQRPGTVIRGGIGYATSPDGIAWTRDPEPVIAPGQCGTHATLAAIEPQVWARDGGFVMLFSAHNEPAARPSVLGATSVDGRTWSCTGVELLDATDIPGSEGLHTIQGITIDGEPALIVESLVAGGSELWLATLTVEE